MGYFQASFIVNKEKKTVIDIKIDKVKNNPNYSFFGGRIPIVKIQTGSIFLFPFVPRATFLILFGHSNFYMSVPTILPEL